MKTKAFVTPILSTDITFTAESTLVQQCYDKLQQEIMQNILKPGEKLKVQHLMKRFSIGQGPIREALSRLSAFGLAEATENKGFRVARTSEADITDTYNTFTHIENLALELAIKHGNHTWEGSVVAALHTLSLVEREESTEPYATWAERNYNFHVALISGCNSPLLLEIRYRLYMKFDRYCRMAFEVSNRNLPTNHTEHRELAEAVLKKDVALAHKINTHHINANRELIIEKLKSLKLI